MFDKNLNYFDYFELTHFSYIEAVGPGMMMYDDFTNEDVGNVIMDADIDRNTTSFNENLPELRSIPSRRLTKGRKRKRNRNKTRVPRRRPGRYLTFV